MFLDLVIKWRRDNQRNMAFLQEKEKQLDIDIKQLELLKLRREIRNYRSNEEITNHDLELGQEHIESHFIETEKLRKVIELAIIEFVLKLIDEVDKDASQLQKQTYLVKIIPSIDKILLSDIEGTSSVSPRPYSNKLDSSETLSEDEIIQKLYRKLLNMASGDTELVERLIILS